MSAYSDRVARISKRNGARLTDEQRKRAVVDVLMANQQVNTYLYSEWDDGAEVGKLADQILAALGAL